MAYILKINDIEAEATRIYTGTSEAALLHYFEPSPGLFIAESEKVISRALSAGYAPYSFLIEEERLAETAGLYADHDVPVYTLPHAAMIRLTGYMLTQGVLCAMKRRNAPDMKDFLAGKSRLAILEDVENPTNVGAIFRSAAALGMDGVILMSGAADPLYRRSARVSMGTVFQVPWIKLPAKEKEASAFLLSALHEMDYTILGLALNERTVSLRDIDPGRFIRSALILGNEDHGLLEETMECCDTLVKIPMMNGVDSLNVSNAAAVAFYVMTGPQGISP